MQLEFLKTIVALLDEAEIPHMLAGSMASTFHGEPRMTRDIDMVIDPTPESMDRFVAALDRPRFYVDDAADAARYRDAFAACTDENHPQYLLWAALSARLARHQGAPANELRQRAQTLEQQLDLTLEHWREIAPRAGGLGFLHLTERRTPVEELIELKLAVTEHEDSGAAQALDVILRLQELNSIALARGAAPNTRAAIVSSPFRSSRRGHTRGCERMRAHTSDAHTFESN